MHKTCPLRYLYNVQPMWRAQVVELSTTCRYFWVKVYNTSLIFVCKKNLKYSSNLCFTQISTSLIFVWEKDSSSKQPDRVVALRWKWLLVVWWLGGGNITVNHPSTIYLTYPILEWIVNIQNIFVEKWTWKKGESGCCCCWHCELVWWLGGNITVNHPSTTYLTYMGYIPL